MRLGLMAYSTDTGLGIQTFNLYKHLKPEKTLLVDISRLNGVPTHHERYPGARITDGIPGTEDCEWLTDDVDAVFVCETPLNYSLFAVADKKGVKTILQYNFEFLDYFQSPQLPKPTVFAAPSLWNIGQMDPRLFPNVAHLPVPIDTAVLPKRDIAAAETFFHIAGRPAIHDRNGTMQFIEAARLCAREIPAKFLLYCQSPTPEIREKAKLSPVDLIEELPDYADLYREGDVLVIPRKFGGLCLSAQEAVGSGIPVLMPNIDPNNRWMPTEWLTPTLPQRYRFRTRSMITLHVADTHALARQMAVLYRTPKKVENMHSQAKSIAAGLSWEANKARYETFIKEICS